MLVLAHGAGAGMRHAFMQELAEALAAEKIATVRWEFPYMAAGKKRVDSPEVAERAVRDAVAAAAVIAKRARLPLFAGGKSFGGRMTSRAHAAEPLPVKGLVFYGFPLHPAGKPGVERAAHLSKAMGPMLFLSGTRDALADLTLLRPIVKRSGGTLHVLEGADHSMARHVRELAKVTRAWIDRLR
jgi:predicted alpha/beta-hydrolase family hydrolase